MTISTLTSGTSGPSHFDVLIVGAGPAGLAVATELMSTPLRVGVLESGGLDRIQETDTLNDFVSVGHQRAEHGDVGGRLLGGSSALWTGRCGTLDRIDFHARPWVPLSGWPIDMDALAPHYQRAGTFLGIAPTRPATQGALELQQNFDSPPIDEARFKPVLWQFSRSVEFQRSALRHFTPEGNNPGSLLQHTGGTTPLHVGQSCKAALEGSPNVHLFIFATVSEISADPELGAVTGVVARAKDGTIIPFIARCVILACGGIQNARLLLASRSARPCGLGNDYDQVGRYLCDHTFTPIATFDGDNGAGIRRRLGSRWHPQFGTARVHSLGLRLSEKMQRHHKVLNAAIHLVEYGSELNPLTAIAKAARHLKVGATGEGFRELRHGLLNPVGLSRSVYDRFFAKRPPLNTPSRSVVGCVTEQELAFDSRVTLSPKSDRFGQPLPQIDWRISEREFATVMVVEEAFRAEAQRLGEGGYARPGWVQAGFESWKQDLIDLAHPSCTTRMSHQASHGVVDANCQVHGVRGLYVAGSSVFASNGHMNPTQTIVALAYRLADHIRRELQKKISAEPLNAKGENCSRIRVGFIGGGHRVETVYAPIVEALSDKVEVCGVVTRSTEGAQRVTAQTGWSAGTDLERLVDREKPDFLIVVTPPNMTDVFYPKAVSLGVPLLLETPFCWNERQGRKLLKDIEARQLTVGVAEQFPFMPETQLMHRLIELGLIGRVEAVENDFAVYDYHGAAVARTLIGRHRRAMRVQSNWHSIGNDGERWLSGTVTCEDGGLLLHRYSPLGKTILHRPPGEFRVYGSSGTLLPSEARFEGNGQEITKSLVQRETEGGDLTRLWVDTPDGTVEWFNPFNGHQLDDEQIAVGQLVLAMAQAVRFSGMPLYSPRAALEDVELINAMSYSADRGGRELPIPVSRLRQKVLIKARQKLRPWATL
jgi:choline dehydrogenase-like flavoprotein